MERLIFFIPVTSGPGATVQLHPEKKLHISTDVRFHHINRQNGKHTISKESDALVMFVAFGESLWRFMH